MAAVSRSPAAIYMYICPPPCQRTVSGDSLSGTDTTVALLHDCNGQQNVRENLFDKSPSSIFLPAVRLVIGWVNLADFSRPIVQIPFFLSLAIFLSLLLRHPQNETDFTHSPNQTAVWLIVFILSRGGERV